MNSSDLLKLLQLSSPGLPVGAYSYSEGLEFLVEAEQLTDAAELTQWLTQELRYGAIRLEAAVMVRSYGASQAQDFDRLSQWNHWLSAARETEELRSQSWQMGRSLLRLFQDLTPNSLAAGLEKECNFAIAFGLVASAWEIDLNSATIGYLHSWAINLINAGIKLIPLGQTAGQKLLLQLQPVLEQAAQEILALPDDNLDSCGWGLALASMAHETQYSRLFRS
ncbi:MAG TPA: urease accessory protein UreF [Thermosynechococcaceae cyanobacterium]